LLLQKLLKQKAGVRKMITFIDKPSLRFSWYYAVSHLKSKYRYTLLGFLWNFLEPALYLVILSLVFAVINRMNIEDYAVFLFSALVPWRYFEKVVNLVMESLVNGEWLHRKMYVSPFAFPINRWIIAGFEFLFSITVAFMLFAFLKKDWTIHLIILPFSIFPWAIFGLGVGMICAVLYTFFRDIKPLVQLILTLTFFTSPILFNRSVFPTNSFQAKIMEWHPITYFAELFQNPVYLGQWPSLSAWVISIIIAVTSLVIGAFLINKFKSKFYYAL
jgi:homopolymeric O-antigen transport system permease protein